MVTEHNILDACGTIYEMPRDPVGGVAGIKPVCTHNRLIYDFCSRHSIPVISGNRNYSACEKQESSEQE